jgi:DNA replication initiation complex subunit (GINS family)
MYQKLYETWQYERSHSTVASLPEDFWDTVREYVNQTETRLQNTDPASLLAPIFRQEIRNVRYLIHDIHQLRTDKLVQNLKSLTEENNWTKEEKWVLTQFRETLGRLDLLVNAIEKGENSQPDISPSVIDQDQSTSPTDRTVQNPKYLLVRFLDALQSIAGLDLRPYGPFQPEDIVTLPVEIARPLIQQNIVVEQRKGRS